MTTDTSHTQVIAQYNLQIMRDRLNSACGGQDPLTLKELQEIRLFVERLEALNSTPAPAPKARAKETKELLELAADLASARAKLDPAWPTWRKQIFWDNLDPQVTAYKARAKELTGFYVIL